ncbi:MAG: hypothetical protein HXX14_20605, partial [Bacteroidetes bacterium]|nr:hypothetical protein [Bacteroidota bacterium]
MRRKISLWVVLLFAWISIVLMILFGWAVWHTVSGGQRLGVLGKAIISIAKFPSTVNEAFTQLPHPNPLFLADKYPNVKSIRSNNSLADDGYIL